MKNTWSRVHKKKILKTVIIYQSLHKLLQIWSSKCLQHMMLYLVAYCIHMPNFFIWPYVQRSLFMPSLKQSNYVTLPVPDTDNPALPTIYLRRDQPYIHYFDYTCLNFSKLASWLVICSYLQCFWTSSKLFMIARALAIFNLMHMFSFSFSFY
jgi:hypothetical protein